MTGADIAFRYGAFVVPVAVVWTACVVMPPDRRRRGAAGLAFVFAFVALLAVNTLAAHSGFWSFTDDAMSALGQPLDVTIAWALLWGTLPTVVGRGKPLVWVAWFAALDVVVMPLLPFVQLGRQWLLGEALVLFLVALPAILLGRWTAERRNLHGRAVLQVVLAGMLLGWLAPAITVAASSRPLVLAPQSSPNGWVAAQMIGAGIVLSVAAVREFVIRGGGTPWPWDPPARIITTGPYRFVGNPMQVGAVLILLGEALLFGELLPAWMALFAIGFSATMARFHEHQELTGRFGSAWEAWSDRRSWWLLRWREDNHPEQVQGVLWVAQGCDPCEGLGRWLKARSPRGLTLWAAQDHPGGPPSRLTYEADDGHQTQGVDALAHALEHLALPWATLGFVLRLPGVVHVAQAIGDIVGFGPQDLTVASRASTDGSATCPTT